MKIIHQTVATQKIQTIAFLLVLGFIYLSLFTIYVRSNRCVDDFADICSNQKSGEFSGYTGDSLGYLDFIKYVVGETNEINQSLILKIGIRPLYTLLSLPAYYIWRSPQSLLIIPFICGVLSPILIYLIFIESGISHWKSVAAALITMPSNYLSLFALSALTDGPAVFFGLVAIYLWILNDKKIVGSTLTAVGFLLAILMRETNVLVLFGCLISDYLNKKMQAKTWYKIPVTLVVVFAVFYVMRHLFVWEFTAKKYLSGSMNTLSMFKNLFAVVGTIMVFSLFGLWSFINKLKKQPIPMAFLLTISLNTVLQLSWHVPHIRYWLTSLPLLMWFGFYWFNQKLSDVETLLLVTFLACTDVFYSTIAGILRFL